jgi:hypothetical protein
MIKYFEEAGDLKVFRNLRWIVRMETTGKFTIRRVVVGQWVSSVMVRSSKREQVCDDVELAFDVL